MSTTIKYPKIAPDFSEAPKGAWSQNSIKDYLYPLSFICFGTITCTQFSQYPGLRRGVDKICQKPFIKKSYETYFFSFLRCLPSLAEDIDVNRWLK